MKAIAKLAIASCADRRAIVGILAANGYYVTERKVKQDHPLIPVSYHEIVVLGVEIEQEND